jgi:hypothetical protein
MATQPMKVTAADVYKLACDLDDLIIVADDCGDERLSKFLNDAADALEAAIDVIGGETPR